MGYLAKFTLQGTLTRVYIRIAFFVSIRIHGRLAKHFGDVQKFSVYVRACMNVFHKCNVKTLRFLAFCVFSVKQFQ